MSETHAWHRVGRGWRNRSTGEVRSTDPSVTRTRSRDDHEDVVAGSMKCPGCGRIISREVYECPHCREIVGEDDPAPMLTSEPEPIEIKKPLPTVNAPPTPAQRAMADKTRNERKQRKLTAKLLASLLDLIAPSSATPGDPPIQEYPRPFEEVRKKLPGTLLRKHRLTGTAGSGSEFIVREQYYNGNSGGEPRHYLSLHSEFFDGHMLRRRSRGSTINYEDSEEMIAILIAWRDRVRERMQREQAEEAARDQGDKSV